MSSIDFKFNQQQFQRFYAGALASCAAEICTLPMDVVKVRLQVQNRTNLSSIKYNGTLDAVIKVFRSEGPSALWKGLSPALFRQATYSSMTMVLFEPCRDFIKIYQAPASTGNPSFLSRLAAGGIAGGISIYIANPFDVAKVRMQADVGRTYKGTVHALLSIFKSEGFVGLFRGWLPNVQRGIITNAAELGFYDQTKELVVAWGVPPGPPSHLLSSVVAGLAGATASNPVDVLKTRLMADRGNGNGNSSVKKYKGMIDCFSKTVKEEGFTALYKGFIPCWLRKGPWCVIFFVCYEQMLHIKLNGFSSNGGKKES